MAIELTWTITNGEEKWGDKVSVFLDDNDTLENKSLIKDIDIKLIKKAAEIMSNQMIETIEQVILKKPV